MFDGCKVEVVGIYLRAVIGANWRTAVEFFPFERAQSHQHFVINRYFKKPHMRTARKEVADFTYWLKKNSMKNVKTKFKIRFALIFAEAMLLDGCLVVSRRVGKMLLSQKDCYLSIYLPR